jgi:hypothetical protein
MADFRDVGLEICYSLPKDKYPMIANKVLLDVQGYRSVYGAQHRTFYVNADRKLMAVVENLDYADSAKGRWVIHLEATATGLALLDLIKKEHEDAQRDSK